MTSSVMLPLVMEKEPRAQKCRPPALAQFRKLLCTRCDERAHEVLSAICGEISTNIWTCSRDNTPETIFTPRSLHSRRRPLGSLEADRALQVRAPSSHREESRAQIRLFNHRVRGSDHARTGSDSE